MKRILLFRTGALGDIVLTLPLIASLRRAFPHHALHLVGHPGRLSLACPNADAIHDIDRADWAPWFSPGAHVPGSPLADVDLVLSWLPDPDGSFAANLTRAGARRVLSSPPRPPDGSCHAVDHLLEPLTTLGLDPVSRVPEVLLTPEERKAGAGLLSLANGSDPGARILVIHPGSGAARKCWSPVRFAGVANAMAGRTGWKVVLSAGPADGDLVAQVARLLHRPAVILPSPPPRELAAALSHAAAYLGNDSGPTHLAAAVATPTVALFGPTDPRTWAPRGEKVRVLCSAGGLDDLPVEQVAAAVLEMAGP